MAVIQEGGYDVYSIPAAPEGGSRFFLGRNSSGWSSDPADTLARTFRGFLADRRADVEFLAPPQVTFELKFAAKDLGEWRLFSRGEITLQQTRASVRPGRRTGLKPSALLLDEFGLGIGDGWNKAADDLIYESLLVVSRSHNLEGRAWRDLQDTLARLICLRAGCEVSEEQLGHPNIVRA